MNTRKRPSLNEAYFDQTRNGVLNTSIDDVLSMLPSRIQNGKKVIIFLHTSLLNEFKRKGRTFKYNFGVASLTITLAEPTDSNRTNEYMLQFISPSSAATTFSYPSSIIWGESSSTVTVGGVVVPNIEKGKTYQISIVNNKGIIGGF